ncbi:MAG: GNAT family N-acetyltransferase [Casimicrobiaceae bacterium]
MTPPHGSADRNLQPPGQAPARRGVSHDRRDAPARSAYPTGNALRRAMVTLREEGWRNFWFKLLSRCGYRRLLLVERPLDEPVPDFMPKMPVEPAVLTERQVDDYFAFRPNMTRSDVIERLRSGQICFVAWHDGRIVSGAWISVQPVWISYLGCAIDVDPGDAHVYDKFTLPAYRGYGIANTVRTFHLRHLQHAGYRRAVGAVLPENGSSLRDDRKGGFRPYGMLTRIRIGPWQSVFRMQSWRGRA